MTVRSPAPVGPEFRDRPDAALLAVSPSVAVALKHAPLGIAIFDRQIDKLHARIAKLEKRLRYVNQNFPQMGTQPESAQPEEADYNRTDEPKSQPVETEEDTETTLFTDDPSDATREAYE